MKRYEHTEVFFLRSLKDTVTFCRRILEMKREAPWSLVFTVAVTARREVQFRGSDGKPRHIGEDLQDLSHEIDRSSATVPISAPTTADERRRQRRAARRRRTL